MCEIAMYARPMPSRLLILAVLLGNPGVASPRSPSAHTAKPCYAEVVYSDQTSGHPYEYRCGKNKLFVGELVLVPVTISGQTTITTAQIIAIHRYRSYFGRLKTVIGPV